MCIREILMKSVDYIRMPGKAFEKEKKTSSLAAFKYMLFLGFIFAVLSGLVSLLTTAATLFMDPLSLAVFGIAMVYLMVIVGSLIWALLIHGFSYIFGARKGIGGTVKAVLYAGTPLYILGWIPLVNILAAIWTLVLTWLGIKSLHGIDGAKAALAVIVPFIIVSVLVLALIYMFIPVY